MAKLHIIKKGDPLLRKISRPVTEITPRILTLLDDMAETMRAADGCGLAAVQVGVLRRVVTIEAEPGKLLELMPRANSRKRRAASRFRDGTASPAVRQKSPFVR